LYSHVQPDTSVASPVQEKINLTSENLLLLGSASLETAWNCWGWSWCSWDGWMSVRSFLRFSMEEN